MIGTLVRFVNTVRHADFGNETLERPGVGKGILKRRIGTAPARSVVDRSGRVSVDVNRGLREHGNAGQEPGQDEAQSSQGLGTVQLPSNQIVTSLALFLSAMVMWPVWSAAYRDGVKPYQDGTITLQSAYDRGSMPIRRWMAAQIEQAGNRETMLLFLQRHPTASQAPATYDEIPLETLLPAFLVSELEVAFTIGFRMLLPFLVLDVLVATLVVSTGLVMLPPTVVSLPFKLLVFVMADGWSLVVQSLLDSIWPMAS